jgi:hypothetical protein
MKRKPKFTPEQRAAAAERLRAKWQDPEWRAKREAGCRRAWERDAITGEIRRKIAASNVEQWKDPLIRRKRTQAIAKGLDAGVREMRRAQLAERRNDPVMEAKRIAKLRAKCALIKGKKRAVAQANNRKRRGFDVPARLWVIYRELLKKRKYTAREAGIVLGLVRE